MFGKKDVNLNLCFFTFMPFPYDEYDDVEFDEMGEEGVGEAVGKADDIDAMKFEINGQDEEFLRKNGITFE